MSITTRTRISELMEYPEALDVLSEYGIDVGRKEMSWTLERLAREHGLNAWELKVDLVDALSEDDWDDFEDGEQDEDGDFDDPDADPYGDEDYGDDGDVDDEVDW